MARIVLTAPRTSPGLGRRGGAGWWFLLVLGIVATVGSGGGLLAQTADAGPPDTGTIPVAGRAPTRSAALTAPAAPAAAPAPASLAGPGSAVWPPPVRLRLPRLGIDAPVLPVAVGVDGLLEVPDNPLQLGWWTGSGRPGMPSASVVIDGHVDSATRGIGALFRLREASPGDKVVIMSATGGSAHYTVTGRRSYAKASTPVAGVFAQDVGPRLVLLTCGGHFDQATHRYADNIVVYAVPQ